MVDFTDKIPLNTFSLLPAPLHVAYRDNEDDDLEKAYKEVCTEFSSAMLELSHLLVLNDRSLDIRFVKLEMWLFVV